MIIIGHKDIPSAKFVKITKIEDIKLTSSQDILFVEFNVDLIKYIKSNDLKCAVKIDNINDLMIVNSLEVDYCISMKKDIIIFVKIAQDYMFDMKILLNGSDEDDISWCAINGIDGIITKLY